MSKLIEYFDREKTTIAILKDYLDQQWKVDHDLKRIKELEGDLYSIKANNPSGVHVQGGGNDDYFSGGLDQKDLLEHGYIQAVKFMDEFTPCWDRLTEQEQDILRLRFIEHLESDGVKHIMEKYAISKPTAYRMINTALARLSKLLFW